MKQTFITKRSITYMIHDLLLINNIFLTSSIYILREQGQSYLFILSYILENKTKTKRIRKKIKKREQKESERVRENLWFKL